jgi:hypothetical protein
VDDRRELKQIRRGILQKKTNQKRMAELERDGMKEIDGEVDGERMREKEDEGEREGLKQRD